MQNFLGCIECSLDSKGRLKIPARFTNLLPDGASNIFVISLAKERCLNLYPLKEWNEMIVERLHQLPAGPDRRNYIRFYSKKSLNLKIDSAGRVAIPSSFLEVVGRPKKVVVVGALDYLEIWAPEDYERKSREVDDAFQRGDWEY